MELLDKWEYALIFINFGFSLVLLLVNWIIGSITMIKSSLERKSLNGTIRFYYGFFLVSNISIFYKDNRKYLWKNIALMLLLMMFIYMTFSIRCNISFFFLHVKTAKLRFHATLMTFQFLFLFVIFYLIAKLKPYQNYSIYPSSFMLITVFIEVLIDIGRHYWLIVDVPANSYNLYELDFLYSYNIVCIGQLAHVSGFITYVFKNNREFMPTLFIPYSIYYLLIVSTMYAKKDYIKTSCDYIDRLDNPTELLLRFHSVCAICNEPMEISDSCKLPCGHCFHIECIKHYVGHDIKCLACGSDLVDMFQYTFNNPLVNEESENDNNDAIVDYDEYGSNENDLNYEEEQQLEEEEEEIHEQVIDIFDNTDLSKLSTDDLYNRLVQYGYKLNEDVENLHIQ